MSSRAYTWRVDALLLARGALLVVNSSREPPRTTYRPAPLGEAQRVLRESLALNSELRRQLARWHARRQRSEAGLIASHAADEAAQAWALRALGARKLMVLQRVLPAVAGPIDLPFLPPMPEPEIENPAQQAKVSRPAKEKGARPFGLPGGEGPLPGPAPGVREEDPEADEVP